MYEIKLSSDEYICDVCGIDGKTVFFNSDWDFNCDICFECLEKATNKVLTEYPELGETPVSEQFVVFGDFFKKADIWGTKEIKVCPVPLKDCENGSKQIAENYKFCPFCGGKLETQEIPVCKLDEKALSTLDIIQSYEKTKETYYAVGKILNEDSNTYVSSDFEYYKNYMVTVGERLSIDLDDPRLIITFGKLVTPKI